MIAAGLYGADEPLASLVLFWPVAVLVAICAVRGQPAPTVWEICVAVLMGLGALLHVMTGRWDVAAPEYAALAMTAGLVFVVPRLARTRITIIALWDLLLGLSTLLGLVAFLDFVPDPATQWGQVRPFHADRLSAPFLSANTAATFYGSLLILALARGLEGVRAGRPQRRISADRLGARMRPLLLPLAALLVFATNLFLTGSRAGISLTMLAMAGFLVWEVGAQWKGADRGRSGQVWVAPLVLCALGLVFWVSGSLYATRLDANALQLGDRGVAFAAYWDALRLRPLLGDGLGSFTFTNDMIATAEQASSLRNMGAAHNVLLQWGLQTGLVGASLSLVVCLALWEGIRRGLARRRRQRTQIRAVLVCLLLIGAHGLFDYALEIPAMSALAATVAGLGRAIIWRQRGG